MEAEPVYSWREDRWLNIAAGDNERYWLDDPEQIALVEEAIGQMVEYWQESAEQFEWRCLCGRVVVSNHRRRRCDTCSRPIRLKDHQTLSKADYEAAIDRVRESLKRDNINKQARSYKKFQAGETRRKEDRKKAIENQKIQQKV